MVVIGANGSGKTRLGVWIEFESEQKDKVHRISAQKSLSIPEVASVAMIDDARLHLLYGSIESYGYDSSTPPGQLMSVKRNTRWGQRPGTYLLDDFGRLLEYLVSEDYEQSTAYRRASKESGDRVEPPETKLDAVKRIWEGVLPHRKLKISGNRFQASLGNEANTIYAATDMSDGERVIFYLIGQALSAPDDGLLIIDEPELHLHRSIQATLWDRIEAERPDCLFVYMTHDLDFAASRVLAKKVCLKGYDGESWDWFVVPENDEIPEETLLEILGGRKPVIFVEGDKGSIDYFLYQKLYPGFTIAPCGGASDVVHATASFSSFESLHKHTSYGIIDRDFRDEAEIERLRSKRVMVLNYSEVEHLLLTQDVLRKIAKYQHQESEFDARFEQTKEIVFREMVSNREQLVSSITASKVEQKLKNYNAKARGRAQLQAALEGLTASVDVSALYDATAAEVDATIRDRDYDRALQTYNNKGLLPQIALVFGFTYQGFMQFVEGLISSEEGADLVAALRSQAPAIST